MGEFSRSDSDNKPANCCRGCHFLAKVKDPRHGESIAESWSEDERQYPWLTDELDDAVDLHMWRFVWIPICYKGIWKLDSLSDDLTDNEEFAGRKKLEDKLTVDRADSCFFIGYQEGMEFDTASELHRIRYDSQHFRRNYRNATTAVFIAGGALVLNFFVEVWKLLR